LTIGPTSSSLPISLPHAQQKLATRVVPIIFITGSDSVAVRHWGVQISNHWECVLKIPRLIDKNGELTEVG